jgi:hypothetical protein
MGDGAGHVNCFVCVCVCWMGPVPYLSILLRFGWISPARAAAVCVYK